MATVIWMVVHVGSGGVEGDHLWPLSCMWMVVHVRSGGV